MSGQTLGGLSGLSGAKAGHKATKWVKWGFAAVGLGLAAITSGGAGPFIVLFVGGVLMILDCVKHPLHILRYLGAMVLFVALLPNVVIGPAMQDTSHGVTSIGDRAWEAAQAKWNERNITVNQGPVPAGQPVAAPTTTAITATPAQAFTGPVFPATVPR